MAVLTKDYKSLQERHLYSAMSDLATNYVSNNKQDLSSYISVSSYNENWEYFIKYNTMTGLVVLLVGGDEHFQYDIHPQEVNLAVVKIGKLTKELYDIFSGVAKDAMETFVRYDSVSGQVFTYSINVECDGEYIKEMDSYYSPTGTFNVKVSITGMNEQLKENLIDGFYLKDMSKGEIEVKGMVLDGTSFKSEITRENPNFTAQVKNLDGDDSNQILRIRVRFKGGDEIDLNPNTITKYIAFITQKPTPEQLKAWQKMVIRRAI